MPAKKSSAKKSTSKVTKAAKKAPVKKAASNAVSKQAKVQEVAVLAPVEKAHSEEAKQIVLGARKRTTTPAAFKPQKKGNTPIVFTMEDVAEILNKRKGDADADPAKPAKAAKKAVQVKPVIENSGPEHRNHAAASLADILGFDPTVPAASRPRKGEVPAKWQKYYDALIDMREHLREGLELHSHETLRRSSKDDSGDLSGYGQHMADAGTDAFDRDFALSLVSSEQEALNEIEDAIDRIFDGSYGVCEITGTTIAAERLEAVPFTRYSVQGQKQLESSRRMQKQRGGAFSDLEDDNLVLSDDDDS